MTQPAVNWGDPRLPERFWNKTSPCAITGCWLWTGTREGRHPSARPIFSIDSKYLGARVHAFKVLVGDENRERKKVVVSCGLADCVNPAHVRFRESCGRLYKREKHWLRTYGLTEQSHREMLSRQHGACAICTVPFDECRKRPVHVDHDHKTGAVRALLCGGCNRGLGHFCDSPSLLRAAADYLEEHGAK